MFVSSRALSAEADHKNRGFVLVTVIWMSGILAAFATSVSVSVRSHALYARNAMSGSLAAGIADGLVQIEALNIARTPGDGLWRACRWSASADAWIAVQDQGGLVDLNTASPALIAALFEGLGLGPSDAAAMASALRDYRDTDSVADQGGSEPDRYEGRSFGPKNAPFAVVEELDQLPGMTRELFERMKPLTTVSSQQTGVDFSVAPAALLQVLGRTRKEGARSSLAATHPSSVSAITVAVRINDGTRFVRRVLVQKVDQPYLPFVILAWETGAWPLGGRLIDRVSPPCLGPHA